MSVPTVTASVVSRAGLDLTTGGQAVNTTADIFANPSGNALAIINNGNAGNCVVTINFPASATVDGQSPTNKTVTVVNGHYEVIGPFPTSVYNDASGNVNLTYSVTSSVKIMVISMTPNQ